MSPQNQHQKILIGAESPDPVLPSRVREQPWDDAHLIKKTLVAKVDTGPS